MGLVTNTENTNDVAPEKTEQKEKPARSGPGAGPILVVLLVLLLLAGLAAGGYWVYVHQDELKEKFFPPESAESVESVETVQEQIEEAPEEKSPSFFRKLIKKDRTITVRGSLIGEEGGAAVMVNEKVIPEGTKINGIRIIEITSQSVVVEVDGMKRRLQIGETFDPDAK